MLPTELNKIFESADKNNFNWAVVCYGIKQNTQEQMEMHIHC
jgi:hypothetical protein